MSTSDQQGANSEAATDAETMAPPPPPAAAVAHPVLNGKRILPIKVLQAGIKGSSDLAAVYAILNSGYKSSSSDNWTPFCEHVGTTRNLEETLQGHFVEYGPERVAHVRALSFLFPNAGAMESVANDWRQEALSTAGGKSNFDPVLAAMELEDHDAGEYDDDDDDDDDAYFEMMAGAMAVSRSELASARGIPEAEPKKDDDDDEADVVSPFDQASKTYVSTNGGTLSFTRENVDKVLEEIRPYLISDGGNVSVERVDETTCDVYLKLEGACGSCPSSTVTMQMGIERVLKENFSNLGQVIQVEDEDDEDKPTEFQVVEREVDRIKPAIIAMGGKVDIVGLDATTGIVELKFQGVSKVRQGLELALLDIDFVTSVVFADSAQTP